MHLSAIYLWVKALHIAFMVTWFAGLFYLPRLFIYHAQAELLPDRQRFSLMEQRLFIIMSIGAALTAVLGVVLLSINPGLLHQGWFRSKLLILIGLFAFHYRCWHWIRVFAQGDLPDNTRWLRWFNEIPVLFLLGIVCLAIVKPF
jgi:putative membrane protein